MPQPQPPTGEELERLVKVAGIEFTAHEDHWYGKMVFRFPKPISQIEAEEVAVRIRALPEIEYAVPQRRGGGTSSLRSREHASAHNSYVPA
jgi:hypothetical protein